MTPRPGNPAVAYGLNAPSVVFYANTRLVFIGGSVPGESDARCERS
jgi:hypothetical protein